MKLSTFQVIKEAMQKKEDMYDFCVFKGCPNEACTLGKSLFPFPHINNPMFEIWLENCGNRSILSRSDLRIKKFGLCSDHFTPDSFYDEENKRLRRDAVPEPYSPTFKRSHCSLKSNPNMYEHNYALIRSGMTDILMNYGPRAQFPSRRCNTRSYSVAPASADTIKDNNIDNREKNGLKTSSESPILKRERYLVKTYAKKRLDFDTNEGKVTSASSSIESLGNTNSVGSCKNFSRLDTGSTNSNSIGVNSALSPNVNIFANERGRRAIGSKSIVQANKSQVGGSVSSEKEACILKQTNDELRAQNNLLKKLNGQLKLKMKKCEDRNEALKASLEKVSSIDGFLDLHRCNDLDVRNLIKAHIRKPKMPSSAKI